LTCFRGLGIDSQGGTETASGFGRTLVFQAGLPLAYRCIGVVSQLAQSRQFRFATAAGVVAFPVIGDFASTGWAIHDLSVSVRTGGGR